ncbi:hypothetical protein TBLA_0D04850 [Henningerozyma blattae CBS 6284]|uniref:RRM domain-containing protein n=1 Tax=Henningerozyma blattae (strain ATCC 34711 / CBS 6284 / DSM 70876 / NBRC 10599 / NRRL Y-10934 / UCD 77-7) TaxID=1071380 RepID=I2H3M9_HENB6|nr:hypothetical protein TBLA_0D04850 [Tetrapisispora blattae CBS 6284]CCH60981.1 hypothetical protein TBLA_0D04850 [Tetrapisispora blattae CBS 6284]
MDRGRRDRDDRSRYSSRRPTRYNNGDSQRDSSYSRGYSNYSRDQSSRGRRDYYNDRPRQPHGRFGGRQRSSRGDYGPLLSRELDSTYEEKVNRNYSNSVFVGNLTFDTQPGDLKDYFSQVGDVIRADIITSKGHHRGMGTVEFSNPEAVDAAISKLDGSYLLDRQIFVRQDNPPPEGTRERRQPPRERNSRDSRDRDASRGRDRDIGRGRERGDHIPKHEQEGYEIFVANVPFATTWQTLKDLFKETGDVLRADVELDRDGYSRGFGIVIMATKEDMERSIERFNGYELEGRKLDVRAGHGRKSPSSSSHEYDSYYNDSAARSDSRKQERSDGVHRQFTEGVVGGGERSNLIYCSNLPFTTARSDLYDLFGTIGQITNTDLKYDSDGKPTGIAIVEYDNIEDADICIDRLNNYTYGGCDLDISYGIRQD